MVQKYKTTQTLANSSAQARKQFRDSARKQGKTAVIKSSKFDYYTSVNGRNKKVYKVKFLFKPRK